MLFSLRTLCVQPPHHMCEALAHIVRGGLLVVGRWLLGGEEYWYETYSVVKINTYL